MQQLQCYRNAVQKLLTTGNGTALVEDGSRLIFVRRPTYDASLFVVGLLTLVLLGNGVMQLGTGASEVGIGLVGGGIVSALFLFLILRKIAATRIRPPLSFPVIATLDLERRVLLDDAGHEVRPLADVRFYSTGQLASSANKVVCSYGSTEITLFRGSAFGFMGLATREVMKILARRGLRVPGVP